MFIVKKKKRNKTKKLKKKKQKRENFHSGVPLHNHRHIISYYISMVITI